MTKEKSVGIKIPKTLSDRIKVVQALLMLKGQAATQNEVIDSAIKVLEGKLK